jgi:hypothetical protein
MFAWLLKEVVKTDDSLHILHVSMRDAAVGNLPGGDYFDQVGTKSGVRSGLGVGVKCGSMAYSNGGNGCIACPHSMQGQMQGHVKQLPPVCAAAGASASCSVKSSCSVRLQQLSAEKLLGHSHTVPAAGLQQAVTDLTADLHNIVLGVL